MSTPIGQRIRAARHHAGLSQQALADRLGLSKSLVAHWERGARIPKIGQVRHLATICQVDPVPILLGSTIDKAKSPRLQTVTI